MPKMRKQDDKKNLANKRFEQDFIVDKSAFGTIQPVEIELLILSKPILSSDT